MNLIVVFIVILQVWTALCLRCKTSDGENGICRRDCKTVNVPRPIARCAGTSFFCCISSASIQQLLREGSQNSLQTPDTRQCLLLE